MTTQLAEARQIAPVVSVENFYNIANRADTAVLAATAEQHIAFAVAALVRLNGKIHLAPRARFSHRRQFALGRQPRADRIATRRQLFQQAARQILVQAVLGLLGQFAHRRSFWPYQLS